MAVDVPKPPKLVLDDFIATGLSVTPPPLHPYFESFRVFHTRKLVNLNRFIALQGWLVSHRLWHQLTQKLIEFFDEPLSQPYRVDVFERFVRDFETKINQLRLVEMCAKVSKDIESNVLRVSFFIRLST